MLPDQVTSWKFWCICRPPTPFEIAVVLLHCTLEKQPHSSSLMLENVQITFSKLLPQALVLFGPTRNQNYGVVVDNNCTISKFLVTLKIMYDKAILTKQTAWKLGQLWRSSLLWEGFIEKSLSLTISKFQNTVFLGFKNSEFCCNNLTLKHTNHVHLIFSFQNKVNCCETKESVFQGNVNLQAQVKLATL